MQVRPLALAAALLPVAAVAAMDPAGWSPFGPAPWLAVSVVGYLAVALAWTRWRVRVDRAATVAWAGLVMLMTIAAVGGLDPVYAWTGTPERHLGVAGWLLIAGLFVAGQQLRWSDRTVLAAGIVAAGAVTAAYSVVEAVWRAPIRLDTASDRLGGPFGSPAFLGAACALFVPAITGIAVDRSLPRWLRSAAGPVAAGCVISLVGSAARAAWVGVVVAGVAAAVALWARRRTAEQAARPPVAVMAGGATVLDRLRRPTGAVLATTGATVLAVALAVVALAVVVLGAGRMGSALERPHGSGSRLDEWRVAGRVIGDRPLLGTGPEGYRLAVPGNVDAAYERAYGRAVLPDRAHSGVLDVTATGGLLAGATYLVLLGLVAVALWRAMRRGPPLVVGLGAGVGAYLAQQQLLFPLAELDPVVWLLAGAVLAWSHGLDGSGSEASTRPRPAPRWQLAVAAVAGVAAVAALVTGVLDVAADRLDRRALGALAEGRVDDAVDAAERAVDLRPDVLRYRLVLGRAQQAAGTLASVDRWLTTVDRALDVSPLDPIVRQERGLALTRRATITGTDADTDAAVDYWRELVADDANNARWQLELGRAAAAAGDVTTARVAWTAAADLAPDDHTAATLLAALPPG